MRASCRHDGVFSSRDEVGCEAARIWQAFASHPECRIAAQLIMIVAVFVSTGDCQQARAYHREMGMAGAQGIAFVVQTGCQRIGKIQTLLNIEQHKHTTIGRQRAAIKLSVSVRETGEYINAANKRVRR